MKIEQISGLLHLEAQSSFHNIQKLNLSSKTDINKTDWINTCHIHLSSSTLLHYTFVPTFY